MIEPILILFILGFFILFPVGCGLLIYGLTTATRNLFSRH